MEDRKDPEVGKTKAVNISMPSDLMEKLHQASLTSGRRKGEIIKEWLRVGEEPDDTDRVTLRFVDPDTGLPETEITFYVMEPFPQKK